MNHLLENTQLEFFLSNNCIMHLLKKYGAKERPVHREMANEVYRIGDFYGEPPTRLHGSIHKGKYHVVKKYSERFLQKYVPVNLNDYTFSG